MKTKIKHKHRNVGHAPVADYSTQAAAAMAIIGPNLELRARLDYEEWATRTRIIQQRVSIDVEEIRALTRLLPSLSGDILELVGAQIANAHAETAHLQQLLGTGIRLDNSFESPDIRFPVEVPRV